MQPTLRDPVSTLIFELSKLPGIGEKTATRLSYFVLKQDGNYAQALAQAILNAKQNTQLCQYCFTFTDINPCRICAHPSRTQGVICVVERPADLFSIEQSGAYPGVYHVLHGVLSPLDGVGPEELKIHELLVRIRDSSHPIEEVILATNPNVEGEATALYLAKILKSIGVRVTRLARGMPVGGLLEYTDRLTIGKALENRMEIQ